MGENLGGAGATRDAIVSSAFLNSTFQLQQKDRETARKGKRKRSPGDKNARDNWLRQYALEQADSLQSGLKGGDPPGSEDGYHAKRQRASDGLAALQ